MQKLGESSLLYRGSVKDVRGPHGDLVVFDYTDAFSVFDWGKMPNPIPKKGESLATLAGALFEQVGNPGLWKEFSKSPEALALRKANPFGSAFNEVGESLQAHGLVTHFRGGVIDHGVVPFAEWRAPVQQIAVQSVSVSKPEILSVLGKSLPDYSAGKKAPYPKLVPLEVVFRFSCPPGSSLIERVLKDPKYLASIGFSNFSVVSGQSWEFPILELFTKLESVDRPLSLSEGLGISGLSAPLLQELFFRTAWTATFLKWVCGKHGLELADGKLEWAVSLDPVTQTERLMLVDAIGPDELRILKDGVPLSKDFLRLFYRNSPWYEAVGAAKQKAASLGAPDWKRFVTEAPPILPPEYCELTSHLYQSLANTLSDRIWFSKLPPFAEIVRAVTAFSTSSPGRSR